MGFTNAEHKALESRLREMSSGETYIEFQKKCIPGVENLLGVKAPALRKVAKELLAGDWRAFLRETDHEWYEYDVIAALLIASAKCELAERFELLRAFVPSINNWGVCDVLCGELKCAGKHQPEFWAFLSPYLASEREFELRFGVVMLLCHFVDKAHIDDVLHILTGMRHDGYYVKMAVAWALSLCVVRFPDDTLPVFAKGVIGDKFTHNKGIQKCIESFRVPDETKERLKTYRRR